MTKFKLKTRKIHFLPKMGGKSGKSISSLLFCITPVFSNFVLSIPTLRRHQKSLPFKNSWIDSAFTNSGEMPKYSRRRSQCTRDCRPPPRGCFHPADPDKFRERERLAPLTLSYGLLMLGRNLSPPF